MNLHNVSKANTFSKLVPTERHKLRPGQILQGKVLKLYPENKAEIQLGGQRLIANLEVGLQVGAKYHFQVQSTANVIQLKVLGEALQGKSELDLSKLLQQLGVKDSKLNIKLLENLIRLKIPFNYQQIAQAAHLLKNEKNKQAAMEILTYMFARKLPINTSIFQALSEVNQTSISDQLKSVIQQFNASSNIPHIDNQKQSIETHIFPRIGAANNAGTKLLPGIETARNAWNNLFQKSNVAGDKDASTFSRTEEIRNLEGNLLKSITALMDKPQTFNTAITQEISSQNLVNNQALFRTLQGLGLIPLNVNHAQWVLEWTAFTQEQKAAHGNNQITSPLPFQLNEQEVVQALVKMNAQRSEFTTVIKNFLNQWGEQLHFHHSLQSSMLKEGFTALQNTFNREISPFFQESQYARLGQLMNVPNQLSSFYQAVQAVAQGDELSNLMQLLQRLANDEQFLAMPPKQQFLQQKNLLLHSLGLDYEQQILNQADLSRQTTTIKGMLLQLMNSPEHVQTEASTRLLHLINGMQIQSVNESQTMLQAAIQIPAERLGLIKDMNLEFEGKKNEDGEINPDYCRILFYLNLAHLQETVIDMNIQQRKVSITVFNNHKEIKLAADLFKHNLEEGLISLGYELAVLQHKKIEENDKLTPTHSVMEQKLFEEEQQGVDYRI